MTLLSTGLTGKLCANVSPAVDGGQKTMSFIPLIKRWSASFTTRTRDLTRRESAREREQLKAVSAGVSIYEVEGKAGDLRRRAEFGSRAARASNGRAGRGIDGKPVATEHRRETEAASAAHSTERAVKLRLYRETHGWRAGHNR